MVVVLEKTATEATIVLSVDELGDLTHALNEVCNGPSELWSNCLRFDRHVGADLFQVERLLEIAHQLLQNVLRGAEARIKIVLQEAQIFSRVLHVVCFEDRSLDPIRGSDGEFEARMGAPREDVMRLLAEIHQLLEDMSAVGPHVKGKANQLPSRTTQLGDVES